MNRNGYETELLAAKVAVEEAKENRFVTELEDKSSQVGKKTFCYQGESYRCRCLY